MVALLESPVKTYEVPIDEIYCDNEFNCRGPIQPIDVVELAKSIAQTGLQQPIIIQPYTHVPGKKWRIVAGHRRYTACRVNKMATVTCIIKENLSEIDARNLNFEENLKRKDLNILQEAKALTPYYMEGYTYQEIANMLGQTLNWVNVRVALLRLPEDIQMEAAAGYLTQEQIKQLFQLHHKGKKAALYEAVKKIKHSKQIGDKKKIIIQKKIIKAHSKARRSREEIFQLMAALQDNVGNSFHTRILAWCAGEITNWDIYRDLQEYLATKGVKYSLPAEMVESALA